jgi:indole-3-glycerol phosphate synthase
MTFLADILARKRDEVEAARRAVPEAELRARARERAAPRPFEAALSLRGGPLRVIAEVKRASPSQGAIRAGLDAVDQARAYAAAGAAAISVLTDGPGFGGSLADLAAVRAAVELPLLRKDFVLDRYQLLEARAHGADAALLIVAALAPDALRALVDACGELGLAALVEVHDERELEVALDIDADVLGLNNRNLNDFSVDIDRTYELLSNVPAGKLVVSESGFTVREQLDALDEVGVDAVLVGETLMRAEDVEAACRDLAGETGV